MKFISNTILKIQPYFTYQLYGQLKVYTTALSNMVEVIQLASLVRLLKL